MKGQANIIAGLIIGILAIGGMAGLYLYGNKQFSIVATTPDRYKSLPEYTLPSNASYICAGTQCEFWSTWTCSRSSWCSYYCSACGNQAGTHTTVNYGGSIAYAHTCTGSSSICIASAQQLHVKEYYPQCIGDMANKVVTPYNNLIVIDQSGSNYFSSCVADYCKMCPTTWYNVNSQKSEPVAYCDVTCTKLDGTSIFAGAVNAGGNLIGNTFNKKIADCNILPTTSQYTYYKMIAHTCPPSFCGNGACEGGEEYAYNKAVCTANSISSNCFCESDCHKSICGDGVTDTAYGEVCDINDPNTKVVTCTDGSSKKYCYQDATTQTCAQTDCKLCDPKTFDAINYMCYDATIQSTYPFSCVYTPKGTINAPAFVPGCSDTIDTCTRKGCVSGQCNSVPIDSTKPCCGDGKCDPGETAISCSKDCNPICGNKVKESGEDCDGDNAITISQECPLSQYPTCLAHKQVKKECGLPSSSTPCKWVYTDLSQCSLDDKCCPVTCGQDSIPCIYPNNGCDLSTNKFCQYSQSTAFCNQKCNAVTGNCDHCLPSCGTPSCSLIVGKCGATCSQDLQCGNTNPVCPTGCNIQNQWCTYPNAQPCQKTCVNGQCQDCTPNCGAINCQLMIGKCNTTCTESAEVACSSNLNNCGYHTCQPNGNYNNCYAKDVCQANYDCVESSTGVFTCLPKEVRITHKLESSYSVGKNIIVVAEIPYFPTANPVYSTLSTNDGAQLQQVECSFMTGIKWSCSFLPVTSGGLYKVKTQVTNPNTGLTVSKEDQVIVREALVVAFTSEDYIQYIGRDIVVKLSVTPFTTQVTKSLKATLYSGLGLFPEEIPIVPTYVPTGGNTWDVKIPAGQITKAGNLKLVMTVGDVSGQYESVTKELTLQIAELGLNVKIEAPSVSLVSPSCSKTEPIIVKTSLGNDLTDVDRLEMRVTYAGNEKTYTKNDFTTLDKGKYSLSFTFEQTQNHYFKSSAWIGLTSSYSEANIPVSGNCGACACDTVRGTCQTDCTCDIDCTPTIPWNSIIVGGVIIGVITLGGIALWRRG